MEKTRIYSEAFEELSQARAELDDYLKWLLTDKRDFDAHGRLRRIVDQVTTGILTIADGLSRSMTR